MTIDENDPIYKAIDIGGGMCCDIPGILCELDKAGFVIVPKEPTDAMLKADMDLGGLGSRDGECYAADPREVWQAMIAAAQK